MSIWVHKTTRRAVVSVSTRTSTIWRGKSSEEYAHNYSLLSCGHEIKRNLNQKPRKKMRCLECEAIDAKRERSEGAEVKP